MCYVIITSGSLMWFLLSLIADMLIISAIVTPKWLIGPEPHTLASNLTIRRFPSVGIYTRCTVMDRNIFNCGSFDINGLFTENYVYPIQWKLSMIFISLGFIVMTATVFSTLVTCCRQSVLGKSIHNITGSAQVVSGIAVLISLFLHPMAWGEKRVQRLCGHDAEAFWPADCRLGWALYCAAISVVLCFICAGISLKAESGNMRSRVKRRIEGGERLVCVL